MSVSVEEVERVAERALLPNAAVTASPAPAPTSEGRPVPVVPVSEKKRDRWIGVILPIAILALWYGVTALHLIKPYFLPPPLKVATTFYTMLFHEELLKDLWVSLSIIIQGFFLGTIVGLAVGFFAGVSKTSEKVMSPTLNAIRQVPPLAWIPLLVLWFGGGDLGKTVLIAKAVFFPVFLNTVQGIRGVSKDHIEVGRIFGYGPVLLLRKIIIPSALPTIFVGIRFAAGMAWSVMIAAEMIGSRYGIGFLLLRAQDLLLTDQLFVIIALIGAVGFGIDLGLRRIEASLLRWRKGFEG